MATYRTRDGDTLDWVCWRHYGKQSGAVEAVLEANRHLADEGPTLKGGIVIELPDLGQPAPVQEVELWT